MISWATVEYSSSLEPEIILKIPLLKAYMLTKKAITIFLSLSSWSFQHFYFSEPVR
jgi:hypothetical protein